MLPCLIPTHPRGHNHAHPKDKDTQAQSSQGPNPRSHRHQDAQVLKSFSSSNRHHPLHEPKLPPSPSSMQQRRRGGGEGGERRGGEPPKPAAGSFLVRGKASNEGPTDAVELVVSAWEPCGAAGPASLLPISTQVLHQSARLLPGAEARGTALLTVGGGHSSPAGPGPCPLPSWGECKPPNPSLTHTLSNQPAQGRRRHPGGRANEDGRH